MLYVDPLIVLADAWADCLAEDRAAEYAKLADYVAETAHEGQKPFVIDTSSRIDALVGRGGGKTTGGRKRFIRRMVRTPGAQCLYIATTREQAEKLMWAPLKDDCERLGIAARFYEDRLRCVFRHNGATLSLAGADDKKQIEKYRGIPHHEVGIDECASFPPRLLEHLIERVIVPRLGDYNGTLWLIGTPGHIQLGPFYDVTRPGSEVSRPWSEREKYPDWDNWSHHSWTLADAAQSGIKVFQNLWKAALAEKARKGWGDDHPVWRREYLAQWAADDTERIYRYRPHDDEGNPWNQWDPERLPNGFAKLPETYTDWSYVYGMDFGTKDPFALEIFAYSPSDPKHVLYHVFEFISRNFYARPIAKLLIGDKLDAAEPGGLFGHTGWPEGITGDGSAQTLLDELLHVYGIKVEPAPRKHGDKLDSIELFNGDLQEGRIKVLKGSELESQLSQLQWVPTETGELREDKGARNDASDGAVYARRIARHLFAAVEVEEKPYFAPRPDSDPTALPWQKPKKSEFDHLLADSHFDLDDF